jgi:methylated-DNA-[protein]-cysteine S-methyltransferase
VKPELFYFNPMRKSVVHFQSPMGWLRIQGYGGMLTRLDFVEEAGIDDFDHDLHRVLHALAQFFNGNSTTLEIPMHLDGTHFQQTVWEELMRIPFAKTYSYEDIARQLGDIKLTRAVASAIAKNPIPILIPCHRVLGTLGQLTGYAGGVWRKQALLKLENFKFLAEENQHT